MNDASRQQLAAFLTYLAQCRLSEHTVANYRRDLEALRSFLNSQVVTAWSEVTGHHIRGFIAWRHRNGVSGRSIGRHLSAIRSFYRYLINNEICAGNPAQGIRAPKSARKLPRNLDVDATSQLLSIAACDPLSCRDKAMLELTYSCALRLGELLAVNLEDLDFQQGMLRVSGKGRKIRHVPVGQKALDAVTHWLVHRETIRYIDQALFVSRHGRRLHSRGVQKRLRSWSITQGMDEPVHPHMLRHACASHLLESSGDLRAVQEFLGHASIGTTQIYTHLDFQHLAHVYDQAHPRAKKKNRK